MKQLPLLSRFIFGGRKELALGGAVLVFALYLLYAQVYSPTAAEIEGIKTYVGSQDVRTGELDSDSRVLADLRGEIGHLERQIRRHASRLPSQERLEEVVTHIYQTADQSVINVERLSQVGTWEREADYVSVPLQIDFNGTYAGLTAFLTRLENSRTRIFVVDNIVITTEATAGSTLRGRIDIRTYYRG